MSYEKHNVRVDGTFYVNEHPRGWGQPRFETRNVTYYQAVNRDIEYVAGVLGLHDDPSQNIGFRERTAAVEAKAVLIIQSFDSKGRLQGHKIVDATSGTVVSFTSEE